MNNIKPKFEGHGWVLHEINSKAEAEIPVPKDSCAFVFSDQNPIGVSTPFVPVQMELEEQHFLVFANPSKDWSILFSPRSIQAKVLVLKLEVLHQFLGLHLKNGQINPKSRFQMPRSPLLLTGAMRIAIFQLFDTKNGGSSGVLFRQSKIMEFLSLMLMDLQNEKSGFEGCPFLGENGESKKIEEARNILIRDYHKPNKIKDLAKRVGTNEYKLKVGFRHLYGNSIHNYLLDQRLENGRIFLKKSGWSVAVVAEKVGYSNPSHFIEAFKKKFGITPKKLISS
jgi:AraC-like DNA-binding protein